MAAGDGQATPMGARLAQRIADSVVRSIVDTRGRLAPQMQSIGMQIFTEATNHVSDEVRGAVGPIYRTLADSPKTDGAIKPLLHHLGRTQGQAFGWIGGMAAGAAMGAGITDLLSNYLSEPIGALIAENPRFHLSPEQAASAIARGHAGPIDLLHEAATKGLNADRMEVLTALSRSSLAHLDIIALLNRGHFTRQEAWMALQDAGLAPQYIDNLLSLARVYLTPEQAAAGWARNAVDEETLYGTAQKWGISRADAGVLMELAGEPPPLDAIITAWRRGIIDESQVDRAIVQGPIRNEWIPTVKSLQFSPLPPEQAASAVTQGHLTQEQGAAAAALYGITAEDFAIIVDNSGLPPGIEFAAEAFSRGFITDQQWEEMFLESRIKNKHIPVMRAMRRKLIPAETVRMAYRLGTYPRQQALETLMGHGYSEVDANALLTLEDVRQNEGTKELTRAQVVDLYGEEIISRDEAQQMLATIGFGTTEVEWMLSLADIGIVRRFVNALVTRVHNAYLAGNIGDDEVMTMLTEAGVGSHARDNYLALWALEREALASNLTTAQIQAAMKRGLLSDSDAAARFERRGYSPADAAILVALARPANG